MKPDPKFEIGQVVSLGTTTKCQVVKSEYYHNSWLYDLQSLSLITNRVFINVNEKYIKRARREKTSKKVSKEDEDIF